MPVEQYELSSVRSELERLALRVKAIEDARYEEDRARFQRQLKKSERSFYVTMAVYWLIIVAVASASITASIVGD